MQNPLVDFVEQSDALFPQLNDHSQVFLYTLRNCCPAVVLPKLNAWREVSGVLSPSFNNKE